MTKTRDRDSASTLHWFKTEIKLSLVWRHPHLWKSRRIKVVLVTRLDMNQRWTTATQPRPNVWTNLVDSAANAEKDLETHSPQTQNARANIVKVCYVAICKTFYLLHFFIRVNLPTVHHDIWHTCTQCVVAMSNEHPLRIFVLRNGLSVFPERHVYMCFTHNCESGILDFVGA